MDNSGQAGAGAYGEGGVASGGAFSAPTDGAENLVFAEPKKSKKWVVIVVAGVLLVVGIIMAIILLSQGSEGLIGSGNGSGDVEFRIVTTGISDEDGASRKYYQVNTDGKVGEIEKFELGTTGTQNISIPIECWQFIVQGGDQNASGCSEAILGLGSMKFSVFETIADNLYEEYSNDTFLYKISAPYLFYSSDRYFIPVQNLDDSTTTVFEITEEEEADLKAIATFKGERVFYLEKAAEASS